MRLVQRAGAIPFVRTNVPQLLMLPETFNAIFGTTCNPFDLSRTSGGSTGGESALIAARGSPLGLGTDVGGSVRIPAFMCGLVAFKPTNDRLSYKGIAVPRKNDRSGQKEVRSSPGPIAHSVADVELLMNLWCGDAMYADDVSLPKQLWDRAAFSAVRASGKGGRPPLKIGYFESDGWFEPAPACARAVREAAETLRRAGHEVVAFPPLEMAEAAAVYVSLLASDGRFKGFMDGIEGEILHPNYAFLYKARGHAREAWHSFPLGGWLAAGGSAGARRLEGGPSSDRSWYGVSVSPDRWLPPFAGDAYSGVAAPTPRVAPRQPAPPAVQGDSHTRRPWQVGARVLGGHRRARRPQGQVPRALQGGRPRRPAVPGPRLARHATRHLRAAQPSVLVYVRLEQLQLPGRHRAGHDGA